MTGVEIIAKERERQVSEEGWSAEHDDGHDGGELAMAAVCYAAPDPVFVEERHFASVGFIDPWPWDDDYDARVRDENEILPNHRLSVDERVGLLAKAGALIAAEIDRLQRLQQRGDEE